MSIYIRLPSCFHTHANSLGAEGTVLPRTMKITKIRMDESYGLATGCGARLATPSSTLMLVLEMKIV